MDTRKAVLTSLNLGNQDKIACSICGNFYLPHGLTVHQRAYKKQLRQRENNNALEEAYDSANATGISDLQTSKLSCNLPCFNSKIRFHYKKEAIY
jgi:hypothetical protein